MFEFVWLYVLLILPLPFVVAWLIKPLTNGEGQDALRVPFFHAFSETMGPVFHVSPFFLKSLFFFAWCFLVIAGMRPVWLGEAHYMPSEARQVMLVLDISGSMLERDFMLNNKRMTRVEAVRQMADDFLQKRTGDAIGIILFGTEAYQYVPLTMDMTTVRTMLKEATVGLAGEQTAIGDALGLALKNMKDLPQEAKVIIFLSDGVANAGVLQPQKAIDLAQSMGVKVYSIGLGPDFVGSFFGQPIPNNLDEELLKDMAQKTGGAYFRVRSTEELKQVYDQINRLEPIEIEQLQIRPIQELFWIPLLCSLSLFLIGFILKGRVS